MRKKSNIIESRGQPNKIAYTNTRTNEDDEICEENQAKTRSFEQISLKLVEQPKFSLPHELRADEFFQNDSEGLPTKPLNSENR